MGSMPLWMWIVVGISIILVATSIVYSGSPDVQKKMQKMKDN